MLVIAPVHPIWALRLPCLWSHRLLRFLWQCEKWMLHSVSPSWLLPLSVFTSLCAPHMRSIVNLGQGITHSMCFWMYHVLPLSAILFAPGFVCLTSRPLYGFVWFVVVVCSCHNFLCCCCYCCSGCCYHFLTARYWAECLSCKYGLHQLCWK